MSLWAMLRKRRIWRQASVISGAISAGTGIFLAAATGALAQSSENFDEAFRKLKRNDNLQFELPAPEPAKPPPPQETQGTPAWLEAIIDFFAAIISFLAPAFQWIFYGLLAAGAAVILYYILREVIAMRRPTRKPKEPPAEVEAAPLYAPGADEARVLLGSIDALAAAGQFKEAVHTLLFRSIQDIELKRPNTVRRSLTSREIANLEILAPEVRSAFSLIAKVVEGSFFGANELDVGDFKKCRAAYEQFAVPKAWTR